MASQMIHLIYCPFTGVGKHQYKGDEWFKERIGIFKDFTLQSLRNQTSPHFILWLSFREEEKKNPITNRIGELIGDMAIRPIMTFDGLMYHDDRNDESNTTLRERLLASLAHERLGQDADWVYLTRIDSDDMFHRDVVQLIQDQEPFEGALTLQNGYVYNKETKELAEWNPLTCPPFFTLMMKGETFFDIDKHLAFYGDWKSHEDTARMKHKVLWRGDNRIDRLYCVLTHDPENHISTSFSHPFRGKQIVDNKLDILSDFGIIGA